MAVIPSAPPSHTHPKHPKPSKHQQHAAHEDSLTRAARDRRAAAEAEREDIFRGFSKDGLNWRNVSWVVLGWIAVMHIGCLFAPFYFSWSAVGVALFLHFLTACVGVTFGYHRYLSHRSLKLTPVGKFIVLFCGNLSAEGSPMVWAATHRVHHSQSDKHGDPHSPLEGPWWSHMLWLFVCRNGEHRAKLYRRYIPDLANDKMLWFFERTYILWSLGLAAGLYAIGGLPWLVWGMCVRMVACYHSTWFVNSATHLWGYRNYETTDESRNLWWVALLSYGEGWHNNHHAHPALARAGHKWWELDPTFWVIRLFQACGLAYDIRDGIPGEKTVKQA